MVAKEKINFDKIPFTDDFMFYTVLENENICKEFLERVLGIQIANLKVVQKQRFEKNQYKYKGIRLDVFVKDVDGNVYDIEMQTTTESYLGKRCRYYHSEMDGAHLKKGKKYKSLKKSIVIFVCTYDPFGKGLSVYTFENRCKEALDVRLDDEMQTIILNTMGNRDGLNQDLKNLLDYIGTGKTKDSYTEGLERQVEQFRHDMDWRDRYMTLEMKMEEKYEQGFAAGEMMTIVQQLCKKLRRGKVLETIAEELEQDLEIIRPYYDVAMKYAPEFNEDLIKKEILENEQ